MVGLCVYNSFAKYICDELVNVLLKGNSFWEQSTIWSDEDKAK